MTAAIVLLLAALRLSAPVVQAAPQDPAADTLRQAQQKMREGKAEEAAALYRQALQISPRSFQGHNQLGITLDLLGQYADARTHFAKAIEVAASPQQKAQAQRSLAISYGFEGDCANAATAQTPVYELYLGDKDFYNAGEVADEVGRICIDAGRLDEAYKWYQMGHDAGLREPDIKADRRDLWEFRWEHAQARIAARRGNKTEAQKHIAAAKNVFGKGTNPEQAQFLPYLQGYVAFYAGDYQAALEELLKANQNDPFIQCMIGQTYQKLGEKGPPAQTIRQLAMRKANSPLMACNLDSTSWSSSAPDLCSPTAE